MHLRRMMALSFLATLKVVSRRAWKQTTTSNSLRTGQPRKDHGFCSAIEVDDDRTIAVLAKRTKELAIANHAQLIERVGVAPSVALDAADR